MPGLREQMLTAASEVEGQWLTSTELRTIGDRRRGRRRLVGAGSVASVTVVAVVVAAFVHQPRPSVPPAAPAAPACPVTLASPRAVASEDLPAVSVARGRLAFTDESGVWVADPGAAPVLVAAAAGDFASYGKPGLVGGPQLAWSPDGAELAMTTRLEDKNTHAECGVVVLAQADGSGVRVLSHTLQGSTPINPVFSPDGRSVAYVVKHWGSADSDGSTGDAPAQASASVVVAPLRGPEQEFTPGCWPSDATTGTPVWSPDGRSLVVGCEASAVLVELDSGTSTIVPAPPGRMVAALGWTPSGALLAALPQAGLSQNDVTIGTHTLGGEGWTQESHPELNVEWGVPFSLGFSPSGDVLLATGSQIGNPAGDYVEHFYPVDVASGTIDKHSALSAHPEWALAGWAPGTDQIVALDAAGHISQVFLVGAGGDARQVVAVAPASVRDDAFPGSFLWRDR